MSVELHKVEIKKVIGPTSAGAAILIGNETKTFVIFIGFYEAAALTRELKNESSSRPLTHDLIQSVLLGFDLTIKQIIISDIVDNAFCATLILEQRVPEKNGEWSGRRNEVRIDARPSDCLVLALKNHADLYVTEEVFEQVQDFSEMVIGDPPWGNMENDIELDIFKPRGPDFPEEELPGAEDPEKESHEEDEDE
ncbi:MAG: bifunctional nuclease family protein [Planctomycetota bacterium]